jgi:hypothetical protein
LVGEVILYEIVGAKATRVMDKECGFALLEPEPISARNKNDGPEDDGLT